MAEKGVEEQVLAMERLPCYGAFTSFVRKRTIASTLSAKSRFRGFS